MKIMNKLIDKNNKRKIKHKNKKKNKNTNFYNNFLKKTKINSNLQKDSLNTQTHHKETIPKRIRELVWTTHNNETFTHKCYVTWCDNNINVFNFQVGHDIPESKGGTLDIDNLKPICGNCNLSMGNRYTISEWCKLVKNHNNSSSSSSSSSDVNSSSNETIDTQII